MIGWFNKSRESSEDESETASDELGSNSNGDLNLISLDVCSSGRKLVEGSNSNNVNSNGYLKYFTHFLIETKKKKKKRQILLPLITRGTQG